MTMIQLTKVVFILFISTFLLTSCSNDNYCKELQIKVNNKDFQRYVLDWIDENINIEKIRADDFGVSTKGGPGIFYLKTNSFDWGAVGFRADISKLKLVGIGDVNNISDLKAIYLGETSDYGILVKLNKDTKLDFDEAFLRKINSKFSVYCFDGR